MKFDTRPQQGRRFFRLHQWHRWFAWRPVRVGAHHYRWLEVVERRGKWVAMFDHHNSTLDHWEWEYRAARR